MWPLKTILYFGLFWVGCLMALVNPIWGVVNYLIAYQTNPTNTWWGLPLTALGMRFSLFAAVFTIVGMFFAQRYVPKNKPATSLWELGIVALVAIAAVNLVVGQDYGGGSNYAFEKLWKMLLFVLIIGRLATTRTNLKLVLWSLVVGSLYLGHDAYTAPVDAFWRGRLEAIGGPDFSTTSGMAAHLSAMLPLIGTAFLTTRAWRYRILAAVAGAFAFNAIVLCRTRSAFIGLACGIVVALLAAPRAKRYRIHALLVIGAVLAFSLTDQHFWTRMETLTNQEGLAKDPATATRTGIWKVSARIIADNPLGIGPGNFPRVIGRYDERYYRRSSHNTLVVCFTELGVQGGLVFLLLTGGSLWCLLRSAKLAHLTDNPTETKLLAYGLLVSLVTYVVTGLGTERFYCESYWWILVLPQCLYRVVVREATADDDVPIPASAAEASVQSLPWRSLQHG